MTPLLQNILVTLLGLIYVFSVVGVMDFAVRRGFSQDLSRKIVHIAAGSWLIFWPLYDVSHWSKYLNITPAFIWTILLLLKGFTAGPSDKAVQTMTRTGDKRELLRGPLYFTLVMNIMGTIFFYTPVAVTAMSFLGWGDGLAPVFGNRFGKHRFHILSWKSIEGSLAFIFFGFFIAALLNLLFFGSVNLAFLALCAIFATAIEAASPKDLDNLLIPLSVIILYYIFST